MIAHGRSKSIESIIHRMGTIIQKSLILSNSSCMPGKSGVFSAVDILPNSVVATFDGILVPNLSRTKYEGKSGKLIEIPYGQPRFSVYYDTTSSYNSCIASKVICVNDVPSQSRKIPNCRLKVDTHGKKAYIVSFSFIPPKDEVLIYSMNI
jgi:hypothetical protein